MDVDADALQLPVAMLINSSKWALLVAKSRNCFLHNRAEAAARAGMRTRGAGVCQFLDMNLRRFVLSVDDDPNIRSRCK